MPLHHSTIRRVHEWAHQQGNPLTLYNVMEALSLAKSTVSCAMLELAAAGFAARTKVAPAAAGRPNKSPSQLPLDVWTVTGTMDEVRAEFCADLPPPLSAPLKEFERVRDVFEYASNCARGA